MACAETTTGHVGLRGSQTQEKQAEAGMACEHEASCCQPRGPGDLSPSPQHPKDKARGSPGLSCPDPSTICREGPRDSWHSCRAAQSPGPVPKPLALIHGLQVPCQLPLRASQGCVFLGAVTSRPTDLRRVTRTGRGCGDPAGILLKRGRRPHLLSRRLHLPGHAQGLRGEPALNLLLGCDAHLCHAFLEK